jgi:hypothetical protein
MRRRAQIHQEVLQFGRREKTLRGSVDGMLDDRRLAAASGPRDGQGCSIGVTDPIVQVIVGTDLSARAEPPTPGKIRGGESFALEASHETLNSRENLKKLDKPAPERQQVRGSSNQVWLVPFGQGAAYKPERSVGAKQRTSGLQHIELPLDIGRSLAQHAKVGTRPYQPTRRCSNPHHLPRLTSNDTFDVVTRRAKELGDIGLAGRIGR